jgi:hypothetical protein
MRKLFVFVCKDINESRRQFCWKEEQRRGALFWSERFGQTALGQKCEKYALKEFYACEILRKLGVRK